ncbi:MAG TPA: ATP-binding protein, partial [Allocoleopsis sp.]
SYIKDYCNALVKLIELYEKNEYKNSQEIEDYINEIDLYFIKQDLPKILSSVEIGAERIRQIVLTLRNFSRLDESDMKAVDIHEGINSTLLILQHRIKPKPNYPGITIMKKYGELPHILCYAGQLNQVFMNILTNSIDALQELEEKNKDFEAPCIIIKTELIKQNHWVRISIKDNGIGMNETVREHLFDPFFTTKTVGKGTGLGLSISYEIIVNKHQGKLECISSPGNGAEFLIEIPVK